MRLATISRTLTPLAVSAMLAACAWAQANISPNTVRDQLNQSNAAPAAAQGPSSPAQQGASQAEVKMPKKPAAPAPAAKAPASAAAKTAATSAPAAKAQAAVPAKPATPAAAKAGPATATDKTKAPAAAKTAAAVAASDKTKPAAPAKAPAIAAEKAKPKPAEAAKAAPKAEVKPEAASAEKAPEEKPVVRRDPFDTLLTKAKASNAPPENLPPGKAGLVVATLRIDGIVHSQNGMIAIVSNPQQRVYFLRDGDKLYDGSVDKIALDAISFHEIGKDAFGKPLERTVTKQLYPTSSGEQQ